MLKTSHKVGEEELFSIDQMGRPKDFVIDCFCEGSELPENSYWASSDKKLDEIIANVFQDKTGITKVTVTKRRICECGRTVL